MEVKNMAETHRKLGIVAGGGSIPGMLIRQCQAQGRDEGEKLYLRLLLMTDYLCGMTDSYAKRLYQEMNGII